MKFVLLCILLTGCNLVETRFKIGLSLTPAPKVELTLEPAAVKKEDREIISPDTKKETAAVSTLPAIDPEDAE